MRARAAPRPAVSIRRRRRAARGTVRREPIETAGRGVAAACVRSGISGWVIGLLIGWRAVAERRAANTWSPWSPMLADGEARRCFLFGTWRSAVAELFGNSRSQQLAAGQPSDVLARCWILAPAERDRSLNLLGKGGRVLPLRPFPRAREGGASASGFDPAAPARSYGDCSARADRNRWPRGGCGVCALWHFRLGDRAIDRLALRSPNGARPMKENKATGNQSPWLKRCFPKSPNSNERLRVSNWIVQRLLSDCEGKVLGLQTA